MSNEPNMTKVPPRPPGHNYPKSKKFRRSRKDRGFVRNLILSPLGTDRDRDARIKAAWSSDF